MGTTWTNDDGLVVQFGTRTTEDLLAGVTSTGGFNGQLVVDIDYTNVGSIGYISGRADNALIPAGSVIKDIHMLVGTAWAGGTSLALDFEDSAGATTPAAGLAAVATASLTAGSAHQGAGAAVGADIPSANSDIGLNTTAVGTFTAGTATVVVNFVKPRSA